LVSELWIAKVFFSARTDIAANSIKLIMRLFILLNLSVCVVYHNF